MYSADVQSIQKCAQWILDPGIRQALFKQFAPTFYFHKDEENFPVNPDDAVRNIITVKRDEYMHIQERQGRPLSKIEEEELRAIDRFFWKNGTFNESYKEHQNDPDFIQLTARPDGAPIPVFLIFDEKHYGYKVGSKIDVVGIAPKGHKKYDSGKNPAPISATIVPTRDGFYIQYQYVYSLNNAIPGTQWLRNILPESWCKAVDDFGFHYGDCEGVGIHVRVAEDGVISFKSMQTFAHGRKGARNVPLKECTINNEGHVCVFVGLGGHPSYADDFVGRNIYMDLVGHHYQIKPTTFIDVSEDVRDLALDLTRPEQAKKNLAHKHPNLLRSAHEMPASLSAFTRFADSNPLAYNGEKTQSEIDNLAVTHNKYRPFSILTIIWQFLLSLIYPQPKKNISSYNVQMLMEDSKANVPGQTGNALRASDMVSRVASSPVTPPVSEAGKPTGFFTNSSPTPDVVYDVSKMVRNNSN